jgi:methionyl-tRNA formyltransferase
MRIVFFGSGEFALPTLDSIRGDGHELGLVVSQPDKARGRGNQVSPTPVKAAAEAAGLAVITPVDVNAPDVLERIRAVGADLGYVAAFGQKIGPALREAFPAGMVNLHGSLLPALRGAAPVQWAVIHGLAETGVTVFRLVDKMDAGPVLTQRRTAIGEDETADELHDRLARIGCDAVRAALAVLQADPRAPGTAQDPAGVSLAPKLAKADRRIDFSAGARELSRRIRGMWSWPGAACRFVPAGGRREERVTLARAVVYEGPARPPARPEDIGRVTDVLSVQAGDGELAILQVKPASGPLMDWRDFVNGRHVRAGDQFMPVAAE